MIVVSGKEYHGLHRLRPVIDLSFQLSTGRIGAAFDSGAARFPTTPDRFERVACGR